MKRKRKSIWLTEQVVASLEALLASPQAAQCLLTPAERGLHYITSLVRRRRGEPIRRVRFDATTADSLARLYIKCRAWNQLNPAQALGLEYLLQQVEIYRSPDSRAARAREVRRVQSYKLKEADGA